MVLASDRKIASTANVASHDLELFKRCLTDMIHIDDLSGHWF